MAAVTAVVLLASCSKEDIPLLSNDDYAISGLDHNKDLKNYLEKVMDDRLGQPMAKGDTDETERRLEYRRRMVADDLVTGLQAKGYYDGKVRFVPEAVGKDEGGSFVITTGDVYLIEDIRVTPKRYQDILPKTGIKKGDVLDAGRVLAAADRLTAEIDRNECLLGLSIDHSVLLDPSTHRAKITFMLHPGSSAVFGASSFDGLETVDESYLRKLIPWKEGTCFKQTEIEKYKTELLQSGLFSRVDVTLPKTVRANGPAPIAIEVKERAHRTISAGLRYYTDEGPGLTLGWEHRNFAGAAEKLSTTLKLAQMEQSATASYTKPAFGRKNQSLTFTNALTAMQTDAYDETSFRTGARIDRKLSKRLSAQAGVDFMLTRIDDIASGSKDTFGLLSVPVGLNYDSRNDVLDPTSGWNINGQIAPYFDTLGSSSPFVKSRATASTYLPLFTRSVVLAMRGSVGSISAKNTQDVPASERFYAGGGGSIRGFGFQEVGPFSAGLPAGGRSVVETNTELRVKLSDTLGVVAFIDAGNVSDDTAPDLDNLAIGVGGGLRYYTDFGPLRFDVATPISKTDNTGQDYQMYISIGQAF